MSYLPLSERTALVTGASRGIGRAIALRLARDGADIFVHYNGRLDAAEAVAAEIRALGRQATLVQANIADLEAVQNALAGIASLDILINNAGWATFGPLDSVSVDDFDALFNLNVRGLFFLTQAAARKMGPGGRIVNISSGITRINAAGGSVYAASKAAVETFTRSWAAELGPRGITVNTVSPGMTETDLLFGVTPKEALDSMVAQTPLGRLGQPEDIADAVALLCTAEARWITANNVLANGGA
jgi:3-oxoacyl-[acyl-carrier protein] reductase